MDNISHITTHPACTSQFELLLAPLLRKLRKFFAISALLWALCVTNFFGRRGREETQRAPSSLSRNISLTCLTFHVEWVQSLLVERNQKVSGRISSLGWQSISE